MKYKKHKLECLNTSDLRVLNFFLRAVVAYDFNDVILYDRPHYPETPYSDRDEVKKIITTSIPFNTPQEQLERLSHKLTHLARENILPYEQFLWLKDSPQACAYCWLYLQNKSFSFLSWQYGQSGYSYTPPISHEERLQNIIDYFDYTYINTSALYTKKQEALNTIKQSWIAAQETTLKIKFLDEKQGDPITWLWNYIEEYNAAFDTPSINSIPLPSPSSTLPEKKLNIVASLHLWRAAKDSKTLFFQRVNRAWSQRKTRHSREHMKAINTYIHRITKEKLDRLVKLNRVNMSEMLERLIEDQYEAQRSTIEEKYGK
ncbi:hypothetical protein ACLPHM_09875 [Paenalcaligenes sp. Me131]|uniref:Uncharacterized protein n=1 Tax=Alcaligenes phenolicus TaxID=232846 RepID=A0AAW5VW78_9BURK|nr:hypothetical protein [Alcaligenes phenolicus]MCX5567461.1 hypothetical protein [Alcaligenes phenolicus]